ncbi:CopG family transcriptional regulator [Ligilactobacillus salivarius]
MAEFTLRLSTELDDSLTKLAEKDGITKTEVIRKALREHIEKQKTSRVQVLSKGSSPLTLIAALTWLQK